MWKGGPTIQGSGTLYTNETGTQLQVPGGRGELGLGIEKVDYVARGGKVYVAPGDVGKLPSEVSGMTVVGASPDVMRERAKGFSVPFIFGSGNSILVPKEFAEDIGVNQRLNLGTPENPNIKDIIFGKFTSAENALIAGELKLTPSKDTLVLKNYTVPGFSGGVPLSKTTYRPGEGPKFESLLVYPKFNPNPLGIPLAPQSSKYAGKLFGIPETFVSLGQKVVDSSNVYLAGYNKQIGKIFGIGPEHAAPAFSRPGGFPGYTSPGKTLALGVLAVPGTLLAGTVATFGMGLKATGMLAAGDVKSVAKGAVGIATSTVGFLKENPLYAAPILAGQIAGAKVIPTLVGKVTNIPRVAKTKFVFEDIVGVKFGEYLHPTLQTKVMQMRGTSKSYGEATFVPDFGKPKSGTFGALGAKLYRAVPELFGKTITAKIHISEDVAALALEKGIGNVKILSQAKGNLQLKTLPIGIKETPVKFGALIEYSVSRAFGLLPPKKHYAAMSLDSKVVTFGKTPRGVSPLLVKSSVGVSEQESAVVSRPLSQIFTPTVRGPAPGALRTLVEEKGLSRMTGTTRVSGKFAGKGNVIDLLAQKPEFKSTSSLGPRLKLKPSAPAPRETHAGAGPHVLDVGNAALKHAPPALKPVLLEKISAQRAGYAAQVARGADMILKTAQIKSLQRIETGLSVAALLGASRLGQGITTAPAQAKIDGQQLIKQKTKTQLAKTRMEDILLPGRMSTQRTVSPLTSRASSAVTAALAGRLAGAQTQMQSQVQSQVQVGKMVLTVQAIAPPPSMVVVPPATMALPRKKSEGLDQVPTRGARGPLLTPKGKFRPKIPFVDWISREITIRRGFTPTAPNRKEAVAAFYRSGGLRVPTKEMLQGKVPTFPKSLQVPSNPKMFGFRGGKRK